jgi:hypothetical protein
MPTALTQNLLQQRDCLIDLPMHLNVNRAPNTSIAFAVALEIELSAAEWSDNPRK